MASNYPGSLDSFDAIASDKKTSDAVGGRTHRAMHNDLGDAIESIEGELGLNPAGIYDTVAERLAAVDDRVLDGTISDIDIAAEADIARSKIAGTALTAASMGVFNVLDYGADPTGVADSTAAIQAAIDAATAAGGGTVWLPPGTYTCADELRLKTGVHLRGAGPSSVLSSALTAPGHLLRSTAGHTDFAISDLRIDGNQADPVFNNRNGIGLEACQRVMLSNLWIDSTGYDAIMVDYGCDVTISDVVLTNCGRNGISLTSTAGTSARIVITNATITGRGASTVLNAGIDIEAATYTAVSDASISTFPYGVVCKGEGNGEATENVRLSTIVCAGITNYDVFFDGTEEPLVNVSVSGLTTTSDSINGVRVEEDVRGWSITDCLIDVSSNASVLADGVSVLHTTTKPTVGRISGVTVGAHTRAGVLVTCDGAVVSGIRVAGCGGDGIYVRASTGVVISGCYVTGCTGAGILTDAASDYTTISASQLSGNTGGAMSLSGAHNIVDPPRLGIVRTSHGVFANANGNGRGANYTYFYRVVEGGTISALRVSVGTQSGNVCVAAYANTGEGLAATPGTRLASSGSIACPAPGDRDLALGSTVTLMAGDWISLSVDNASAQFLGYFGAGVIGANAGQTASKAVFPAPASSPGSLNVGDSNSLFAIVGVS